MYHPKAVSPDMRKHTQTKTTGCRPAHVCSPHLCLAICGDKQAIIGMHLMYVTVLIPVQEMHSM